jgi:N-acetylmuramoyl-L-alanine amidase
MRKINYIVIHCTATQPDAKVKSIQNYWHKTLGWNNPGYHILIDPNGTPHQLQYFDNIANGVRGFNKDSIHISYIGGVDEEYKPKDTRTDQQKIGIMNAIYKAIEYAGHDVQILGHRDFPKVKKACPSFDAKETYSWVLA